jgi:peptide chain release factor 1
MAKHEMEEKSRELSKLEKEMEFLLIPKDPDDKKNAIIEIRAGTGGDEAGLFAGELYKMYSRWCEKNRFKIEIMDSSPTELGGFKEIIFMVTGDHAYGKMKFESGTHRVQRVPETETSGRIHTSAATVAVLPEQEEVDVEIKPEELKIEVCRASGAGGQHVNKTESAVRIIHLPTGMEAFCQDDRSQVKNREKAMKILRARVKEKIEREEKEKLDSNRRAQIGSGDRSEKIRTYNFPQNRVTDHRIGLTVYSLESVMLGDIDEFITKLTEDYNKRMLESA